MSDSTATTAAPTANFTEIAPGVVYDDAEFAAIAKNFHLYDTGEVTYEIKLLDVISHSVIGVLGMLCDPENGCMVQSLDCDIISKNEINIHALPSLICEEHGDKFVFNGELFTKHYLYETYFDGFRQFSKFHSDGKIYNGEVFIDFELISSVDCIYDLKNEDLYFDDIYFCSENDTYYIRDTTYGTISVKSKDALILPECVTNNIDFLKFAKENGAFSLSNVELLSLLRFLVHLGWENENDLEELMEKIEDRYYESEDLESIRSLPILTQEFSEDEIFQIALFLKPYRDLILEKATSLQQIAYFTSEE